MVHFRRMIPVLAVLAFLLGSAVTASAQNQNLTCTANGGVNTPVRAEGLTELVGDFLVTCFGGTPTALGAPIPTVTIQVFLNTQITSRCMESTTSVGCIGLHSEALLLLDEPAPGNPPAVASSQFGCATNTCANLGNGTGTGYYGGGTITTVGNNRNVFQGIQTASNSVTFVGIPIDPPGTAPGAQRVIRITNIRANANGLGTASGQNAPTAITATITTTPSNFMPVSGLATQSVGSVQLGLDFSLRKDPTTTDSYSIVSLQQCVSQASKSTDPPTRQAYLRYTELFPTAFKKRSAASSVSTPSAIINQNDLTAQSTNFNTETGFRNNALTLPFSTVVNNLGGTSVYPGEADWGTRLKATFNNIPKDVRIYVDNVSVTDSATPDVANLVAGETSPYAAVTGTFASTTPSNTTGTITELPVSNGTATAVWEVVQSDQNTIAKLNFGVYVRYSASPGTNSPALGTATVNGSYAPISTVTSAVSANIPRFADTSTAKNLFNLNSCVTNLLFPFVTTQLGFDTGLAISSTSSDPFGTSLQSGTCDLNFYGAAYTGKIPLPGTVTAGTTSVGLASTLLSNVAGGFSGYMIAVCKFQYAHGFAFVSDLGARNIAMGYLALIIPDPARSAKPAMCGGGASFQAASTTAGTDGCKSSGEQLNQ